MILLKLEGGMGNQMFQYAFARYLQMIYNETIYVDTRKLKIKQYGLKYFELNKNVRILNVFLQYVLALYTKLLWSLMKSINKTSDTSKDGAVQMSKWGWFHTSHKTLFEFIEFKKVCFPMKIVSGLFQNEYYLQKLKRIY